MPPDQVGAQGQLRRAALRCASGCAALRCASAGGTHRRGTHCRYDVLPQAVNPLMGWRRKPRWTIPAAFRCGVEIRDVLLRSQYHRWGMRQDSHGVTADRLAAVSELESHGPRRFAVACSPKEQSSPSRPVQPSPRGWRFQAHRAQPAARTRALVSDCRRRYSRALE